MTKYGFIGTGNMAQAMIKGLIRKNIAPQNILVTSPSTANQLAQTIGVTALSAQNLIEESDVIILAFLPQQLEHVTSTLNFDNKLVVSVLADVTLEQLQQATQSNQIVRTLPNVNVAINQGVTAYEKTMLSEMNQRNFDYFSNLLGENFEVKATQFKTFSAVAGSGPAYAFKFIDALVKIAENNGLSADLSTNIVLQMLIGSTNMVIQSGQTAKSLQESVASPGGSTQAGLDALDTYNFDKILALGIEATINHGDETK